MAILKAYSSGSDESRFLQSIDSRIVVSPFLLACSTRNAKYSTSAVQCLQILITHMAIKAGQVSGVVEAFQEAAHLGTDIQLKILQTLPSLLQIYGGHMTSDEIVDVLSLCASLQNVGNKSPVVVNTAIATLQQLVLSVFERASDEKASGKEKINEEYAAAVDANETVKISAKAFDALRVFSDVCSLIEAQKPSFLTFSSLPETFGLELLESILTNHTDAFKQRQELIFVLRTKAVPMLLRAFSEKREFAVTVRAARILFLLIRRLLSVLNAECEALLFLLNHNLSDHSVPTWKKILCVEMLQGIFSEFNLVKQIFQEYDSQSSSESQRKPVIKLLTGSLRLISHDSIDASRAYEAMATNINEVAGHHTTGNDQLELPTEDPYFLSKTSSQARMPFIDLLDKSEPPTVSTSYLYYLVFESLVFLVDGLAKYCEDTVVKSIVESTWSELYRSFLSFMQGSSGMDNEVYHRMVRHIQKLTHVCGLVDNVPARDSLLDLVCQGSVDVSETSINSRNLLFCRALLNLCISLGPRLDYSAWIIVFKTLFNCDCVVNGVAKSRHVKPGKPQVFAQYTQVDAAFTRFMQNTSTFSNAEFKEMIQALAHAERDSDLAKQRTTFLLDMLGEIGSMNISRFAGQLEDREIWSNPSEYLLNLILTRTDDTQWRAAAIVDDLILRCCAICDKNQKLMFLETLRAQVTQITTDNGKLFTDMHAMAVETLKKVLDQCSGNLSTDEWNAVFDVILTVFVNNKLVKIGFETITLVCNDFLYALVDECLIRLVNTLAQFCTQQYDLNVSFTAISIFWTVSDYLIRHDELNLKDVYMSNEDELREQAEQANYSALWILCVLHLSAVCEDSRPQVRHGAIQVLFRIFESHGNALGQNTWKSSQEIVEPVLFKVKDFGDETISLILAGFSSLYGNFMAKFLEMDEFFELWKRLFAYFQRLAEIETNPEIALAVYKSIQSIIVSCNDKSLAIPEEAVERAWSFWTSQPIPDDTHEAKATQEAITGLVSLYSPLVKLGSSPNWLPESVKLLTASAAVKFLPPFYSDKDHLSPLQERALKELCTIDASEPLVVQSLAKLAMLCFDENENDEGKTFTDTNAKRPTYINLCHRSLSLIDERLPSVKLDSDETVISLLGALLTPMQLKFNCPEIAKKEPIWHLATRVFLEIEDRCCKNVQMDEQVEKLVLSCGMAILQCNLDRTVDTVQFEEYEKFDIEAYQRFISCIKPSQVSEDFWDQLVAQLFESSIIHVPDWDKYNQNGTIGDISEPPFFGSTCRPQLKSRKKLCYRCLDELFRLSSLNENESGENHIKQVSTKYLEWRIALTLSRYVSDQPLRGRCPAPMELGNEMSSILEQCKKTSASNQTITQMYKQLLGLISRCVSVASYEPKVLGQLQEVILAILTN